MAGLLNYKEFIILKKGLYMVKESLYIRIVRPK